MSSPEEGSGMLDSISMEDKVNSLYRNRIEELISEEERPILTFFRNLVYDSENKRYVHPFLSYLK